MAYNTPTTYNSSMGNSVRTVSPSSSVQNPQSNYVSTKTYRGFSSSNPNARNSVLYDADIIKQDIYNHFMTAKGERVMLPEFGSIIWNYLYEPLDEQTKEVIELDPKEIVGQDPRVSLVSVGVVGFENGIVVNVALRILPQNQVERMSIEFNVNGASGSSGSGGGSGSGGSTGSGAGGGAGGGGSSGGGGGGGY